VLHPDDAERTIAAWKQCVRSGGTWDIEHRFRGVDGQWHPVLARGVPVRNEQGQITCWVGINLDIGRLKRTEEALQASLAEKEVLLKEIHHRVKNNMQVISSLLDLQADQLKDDAMRAVLQDVTHRVRSMALVHEKLYQSADLARIEFAEYAQSLLGYLWRAHGTAASGVRLTLDLEPVPLSVNAAVPCGLILNELASNALKHAFRGRDGGEVTVSLRAGADGPVCLRVRDNGPGLPPGLDWRQADSLGLRLVQMLAGQLHATVEVGSGEGVEFAVTFAVK
jgi:two-component sensor histidine kinase